MSREAPPESPPDVRVPPPEARHAALWLALPLVALGLPVAYRVTTLGDLEDALRVQFVANDLELLWYAATFASALMLMGFMVARRRGRALWPALDVVVACFPWIIALGAQSLAGEPRNHAYRSDWNDSVSPWGLVDTTHALIVGMTMSEARGLGALVAAALLASVAVGLLLAHAEAPRWRGAGLAVVTLPAWGVVYGMLSSGSALPFIGALLLTAVVAFAGTQASPDARSAGSAAVLAACLAAIALNVAAACETVVASRGFMTEEFFALHARLYDTLRAARLSPLVLLVPALLAPAWLSQAAQPRSSRPSPGGPVLMVLVLVGVVGLDAAGTQLALARITPAAWPPWSGLSVAPLPLGDAARSNGRRSEPPRFILQRGELQDATGRRVARLSDGAALRAALASAPMAWRVAPEGDPHGERLAIMPALDQAPTPAPLCHARVVSVLIDQAVTMEDLRVVVAEAVASGVAELDVVGPWALSPEAKRSLREAVRAAGLDASWPAAGEDELAYTRVAAALPATGFAPLDLQRQPLVVHTALLPSPCWLRELAGPQGTDGDEPGQVAPPPPEGSTALGERLNEMPVESYPVMERRMVGLWLDPARSVAEFLLLTTAGTHRNDTVIWTLEPPAP